MTGDFSSMWKHWRLAQGSGKHLREVFFALSVAGALAAAAAVTAVLPTTFF